MAITKRQGARGVAYRVTVDYPADVISGKRKQRTETFRTRKEAESREREWLTEIERGTAVDGTKATVAEHLTVWLDTVAQHSVRPTTLAGYRATVTNHIIPRIGDVLVQKITAAKIQAMYSAMLMDGKGARTVQLVHLRLQQALAVAVQWNIIAQNPCDRVKPPRNQRKELRTWNRDEVRRFLTFATDDVYAPIWQIALATGMRRGELLGLRWKDLDLAHGIVTINQSVALLNDAPITQQPKTSTSRRSLRLPAPCVDALRDHRDRQAFRRKQLGDIWTDCDLIFANATGGIIHPRNLLRNFDQITHEAEIPRIRFHDLRHTYATLSLSGGADIKTVSSRLGHSSIQVTGDVYAHVTPEMDERATTVISNAIFGMT